LFSGIGGFSLGLERAGMDTVAFCEFDKHAQKVLNKHWPDIPIHEDVRLLDGRQYRGTVDVVCGGFPCQDLSNAGNKAGINGERSSLYREMLRIISECLPRYAIFENVSALLTGDSGRWFAQFLYDLAEIGYDAEWHCIPASELGAHHHRDRVWVIAYPNNNGPTPTKEQKGALQRSNTNPTRKESAKQSKGCGPSSINEVLADTSSKRQQGQRESINAMCKEAQRDWKASIFESVCIRGEWSAEPKLGRVANGIPDRMDRLTRLGNAVVPQIPELIGKAIMDYELTRQ